jgi:two-component system, chemotaxis family, protein-glutamate methylesterase/glutaminase
LTPLLVEKVRTAVTARVRHSLRLTERLRLRANVGLPNASLRSMPGARPSRRQTSSVKFADPLDGVVLVGVSTGGPPALDALLSPLPVDYPWPILVAQHMPATFTGPLARRLDKLCALTVVEVTETMPLLAGHVYIAKGDTDMIVSLRAGAPVAMAAPALSEYRWHPSVDRLVSSAMQHLEASHLIGVLLTGMGNDGAAAMTRLRAQGGRTIAEAEETAVVWGMPGELVRAGGANSVVPLDKIAHKLVEWVL